MRPWSIAATVGFALCCTGHAALNGFTNDLVAAKAEARSTGRLIFAYFDLAGCPGCTQIGGICLSEPAFLAIASTYVLVQLDAVRDSELVDHYGVTQFPNFTVLDAEGQVKVPTGTAIGEILFHKPPPASAEVLMNLHYRLWSEADKVPPSADVVIAQLELLRAYREYEAYEGWLDKGLHNAAAPAQEIACLKVYRGLCLRREGELQAGLQLIGQAAPGLTLGEAQDVQSPQPPAPFTVRRGDDVLGVVGSDCDPRLVWEALSRCETAPPALPPEGLRTEELLSGAAALSAALNRPLEAREWFEAYKATAGDGAFSESMAAVLVDGLLL